MSDSELRLPAGWHLDKKLSIGHLLTTLVVGVSAVMWMSNVEKRVSILEQTVVLQQSRTDRMETRFSTALGEIKDKIRRQTDMITAQIARIDQKLDSKSDKGR